MEFFDTDFLESDEIKLIAESLYEGDPVKNWVPAYRFGIFSRDGARMGSCDLRVGYVDSLYYSRHIGYQIDEEYRGHHYAAKACRLLFLLAKKHGMEYVIITCRPDNIASRKTCELAGCRLLEIAELPPEHDLRKVDGETHECIYRYDLN